MKSKAFEIFPYKNSQQIENAIAVKLNSSQQKQMDKLNEIDGFPTPPIVIEEEKKRFDAKLQMAKLKWQVLTGFIL